jgi:tyrosine-specific transport protein
MMKLSPFLGGILLIAGTAIGAGMLALPVTTCFAGFFPSMILFLLFWLYMTFTALLYLEVNLAVPGENNLITMAQRTLGTPGKIIGWISYLFLLYSLNAAYIAGSSPLFSSFLEKFAGITLASWAKPLPLLFIFALFVYLGTKAVDYMNRVLMLGLIITYLVLVFNLPAHVEVSNLLHFDFPAILIGFPVVLTSFGFHIIIPSLTTYLKHDRKKLIQVILIGSFIALLVYVVWEFLTLGSVPLSGPDSLSATYIKGGSITAPLMKVVQSKWIGLGAALFAFFAILTSFLGVSLSLSDFLSDGFKIKKTSFGRTLACLLTFLPPFGFVTIYPDGFLLALEYAGLFVAILLGILPALMAWKLTSKFYRSIMGKSLLSSVILFSLFVIVVDILQQKKLLSYLVEKYLSY